MLGWSRMVNRAGPATEVSQAFFFPQAMEDGGGGPAGKAEQGRRWPLHPAQKSWSNPGDLAFCPHRALPSAMRLWRQSCWWTVRPTQMLVSWAHTRWTRDAVWRRVSTKSGMIPVDVHYLACGLRETCSPFLFCFQNLGIFHFLAPAWPHNSTFDLKLLEQSWGRLGPETRCLHLDTPLLQQQNAKKLYGTANN